MLNNFFLLKSFFYEHLHHFLIHFVEIIMISFQTTYICIFLCKTFQFHFFIPRVLSNFFQTDSFFWIFVDDLFKQVTCWGWHPFRNYEISFNDFFIQFICVIIIKRQITCHHCVKYYSERPYISFKRVVFFFGKHFRRSVAGWSAGCIDFGIHRVKPSQTKINQFNFFFVFIKEQILGFQVSMDNINLMEVL